MVRRNKHPGTYDPLAVPQAKRRYSRDWLQRRKALTRHMKQRPEPAPQSTFQRKSTDILHVTCPVKSCRSTVSLVCPYCHHGGVRVNKDQGGLSCHQCHGLVKEIYCSHGHEVKVSYIHEKQKELYQLMKNADGKKLGAIFGVFLLYGILLELVVTVIAHFGGY